MKIGVGYNIFSDAIELLESSIKSIRNNVDYVTVIYQDVSNFGNQSDVNIKEILEKLKNEKLVDSFFLYKPQPISPHQNEINKRNMGLYVCENAQCTHFMTMDSDEYYTEEQLKFAIKQIVDGGYDSSACQMRTYYKEPIYQVTPPEDYYVSLFYKIRPGVNFVLGNQFPVLVDPSRRMNPGNCKIFTREEIEMHHMSYVRKDLTGKLMNSSARMNFDAGIPKILEHYNNFKEGDKALFAGVGERYFDLIKVENIFNI